MMGVARFIIRRLAFTGPKVPVAELLFADGVSVIWGASNTGKSFTVKALDFMSGAKPKMLPDIKERQGYDKAWLDLTLPKSGQVTLTRARGRQLWPLRTLGRAGYRQKGQPHAFPRAQGKGEPFSFSPR